MDLIKSFMTLPEIWERCADDLADEWTEKKDNTMYVMVIEENEMIGVIQIDGTTSIEMTIHPYLLKKYRFKGREMMFSFYKAFLDTDYHKIRATIPFCYKSVFNFAKKVGFELEGIQRLSTIKQGNIIDQWVMGITRSEVEKWVA